VEEATSMSSAFGRRLKELRANAKLTQEALAHAAGVTLSAVSKIEAGKVEPTWATARAIAKALGVSVAAFEVEEGEPSGEEESSTPAETEKPAAPKKPRKK
jgi:transcriptional regulator with XRE-family HTH domain